MRHGPHGYQTFLRTASLPRVVHPTPCPDGGRPRGRTEGARHDRRMSSVRAIADAYGGIARRDQFLDAGASGSDLTRAVRLGELRRIRRAHYASAIADRDAAAAVRVGGRLAGTSAARSYGVWAGFDDRVHLVVARNAARLRLTQSGGHVTPDVGDRPVRVHWEDAAIGRECWRVPLLEALRQIASWCDAETAQAALESALDQRFLTLDRLAGLAAPTAAARLRLRSARSGSGSGYETVVARRLRRLGHRVRQQVVVPGVGRVDREIDDYLLLEIDGDGHHRSVEDLDRDARRDAAALAQGRIVLRLRTRRIRDDWQGCLADIQTILARRPSA